VILVELVLSHHHHVPVIVDEVSVLKNVGYFSSCGDAEVSPVLSYIEKVCTSTFLVTGCNEEIFIYVLIRNLYVCM